MLSPCDESQRLMSYLKPPQVPDALRPPGLIEIDSSRIDDDGAGALEVIDRGHEDFDDLGIGGVAFVRLPEDADAPALQSRPS